MRTRRYAAAAALVFLGVAAAAAPQHAQAAAPAAGGEQKLIAVLKSNAPLFDKAKACQRLAVIGSAKAVGVLAGLLGDERLGDYARTAMEPIEDPSVDDAFRKAMGTLKGRLLAGVVNSIGVRRDAKAVGALKKLMADPGRGAAPQALGRIATDDAVQAVRQTLTTGPAKLRGPAADACLVAAERLLARKKPGEAAALYNAVRKADVPEHLKAAAAYHAIVARGPAGVGLLVEQLRASDPAKRGVALRAARAMPAREVTVALAAELGKSPPAVQVLLIKVLVKRGDPAALKAIATLAAGRTAEVRAESLKALGRIGDASVVGVLLKAAAAGGSEAAIARTALRTLKGDGVDAAVLAGMKGSAGLPRAELIGVLADRRYAPAGKAMFAEAASGDESVAKAAFKALAVLADPKDIPAMVKLLLGSKSASAVSQAEATIAVVAGRLPDPAKRADAVLAALVSAKQTVARCSLIRVLGRIGGAKAYQAIGKAIGDDDAEVKDAAVRSLASWPDAQAAPALLEIVKTTKNTTHRILALRGYVRLLALDAGRDPKTTVRKYAEAMSLAQRPDAKKLVLSGLAGVAHGDALKVVLPHLDDAAVRDEAALAAVSIARATMGTDRKQARAAMVKLQAVAKSRSIVAQARRIIGQIDKFADAITAWRVAGPYMKTGLKYDRLFSVPFAPEQPGAKGIAWRPLAAGTDPKRPAILDLLKAIGGAQRVAYVLTWIHSDKAQPARLELGSDDGVKAWLSGKLVHANNTARAAIPYTDKANVTLKAGWNPLLLKITQNDSPWEFCARICRRDGKPLDGIRIDPTHQGQWMSTQPAVSNRPDGAKAPIISTR